MTAAAPPFPEAALRAVLAGAVAAWARAPSAGDEPRRWYVDAFAGAEFQFGTGVAREAGDETRATAAVRALGAGATAVLVEEDPAHLQRLYAELEDVAGGERLRATRDLASLAPGEVSLVESPFAAVVANVARCAAGGPAFAFLAPPAARALPWEALRPLAALPEATLLIRLPLSDFEKQSRHAGPLADLPGFARRIVEGCSAMVGDPKHAWLPVWRDAFSSGGVSSAMDGVMERFAALLTDTAAGRTVKPMVLETPDGAAAYLFLVTPDPAVAAAVTAAAGTARLRDRLAPDEPPPEPVPAAASPPADIPTAPAPAKKEKRARSRPAARPADEPPPASPAPAPAAEPPREERLEAPAVLPRPRADEALDLFAEHLPPEPARPGPAELAELVAERFAGQSAAWADVQRTFAASDVTPDELKKALAVLRRGGRAVYKALKGDGDPIEFPTLPATPPVPSPKRRRKAADAGWFGEEE